MISLIDDIEERAGVVAHEEAHQILLRFCASHFRNGKEHARASIPANPRRDDDLRMGVYIRQQERKDAELERLQRIEAAARAVSDKYREPYNHDPSATVAHMAGLDNAINALSSALQSTVPANTENVSAEVSK